MVESYLGCPRVIVLVGKLTSYYYIREINNLHSFHKLRLGNYKWLSVTI